MPLDPDQQLGGSPNTVNEDFFDAMVRHQIGLLRLSGGIRNKVLKLLDESEADMADKIRSRLANVRGLNTPRSIVRLENLLGAIRATRLKSWRQVTETWLEELREVAKAEPVFIDNSVKTTVPVVVETVLPATATLVSLVNTRPFEGQALRQWAKSIERADLQRIEAQIRIGLVQGESSQAIARRVVGTARLRGVDGATEITRRQAQAITRTAVNAISNMAKREYYTANADLFDEELYVATLDARTTAVCRANDGERFPIGEGPLPPLHFNCRSLRIAVFEAEALGRRPARRFTEQQLLREYAKSNDITTPARRSGLPRGHKGAFDNFRAGRIRELTGQVPAKVSYQEWLGRQSAAFQDDVLGKTKGRLFRRGNLTLDKFVNRRGDELSLSALARREADAFRAAGLDPDDFR